VNGHILLRPCAPGDLPGVVRLQQGSQPLHPWSVEELERDLAVLEPHLQHRLRVAVQEEVLVGMSDLQRPAGSYHPQRFLLQLCVAPEAQGQGVGTRLFEAVLEDLRPLDPLSLSVQVREADSRAMRFADARDFQEVKRDFESVLALDAFAVEAHREAETRLLAQGIAFRTFRELDGLAFRRRFHEAFEAIRVDIPRADPPVPLTFDFFQRHVLDEPGLLPDVFVFALEGPSILGFTGGYQGAYPGVVDTWLTGVLAMARGRGLATALKVRSLCQAQRLGFHEVRTDNDTRNAPMLAVNDRLGFQRRPALVLLRKVFPEP
jgi:mycothiol synthase